ncbi:carbonic anhydrase [Tahibacter soli]|jgi:carbonic anhydrase|uniref:Carbonic anhydrase n=1 Tax=Tahibacter soli TaxID=2983605 RepID=A0A9X4BKB1_9GAMM|nr:carbonic anhydrase family protein [Tahibacter soli]MDC8013004.1 carbonic anhydrase family protein [Tahibacter soli]
MRHLLAATALVTCLVAGAAGANEGKLDYAHQEKWPSALDRAQSPIDIVTAAAVAADDNEPQGLQIWRSVSPIDKVEDNGHAVQVDTHSTEAMIRGRHFTLAQFHFHAASEHTIDGKHYPLEGHFVFKAQDGRLAVIGVMFAEGEANAAAQTVIDDLKPGADVAQKTIDIGQLLPKQRGYYHYLGSLTTPPLTENVEWYVLPAPVTMSKAQLDAFLARYPRNNRKLQPLNGRPVIRYGN